MTSPRKETLTQLELKSQLSYNPDTGIFVRISTSSNSVKIGDVAGSLSDKGYLVISFLGKRYRAHRLVFLYMTGAFPKEFVDHINHLKADNRWSNLRECTKAQNGANRGKNKNNTSGYKGVSWIKRDKKFKAVLKYNGKQLYLGSYYCKHNAAIAYNKKELELFGEFAYLNKISS